MIFLAATSALLLLVWSLVFLFRGSLLDGVVGLLVVGYCLGHHFLNFDLGPLPMTLDRLVVGGLTGFYLLQRLLHLNDPKPLGATDWLLVAFIGVLCVSTFTHDWQLDRPGKISPLWLLVAGYLVPAIIYLIARDSHLSPQSLHRTYGLLALFGVYLTVTALAEITHQWWLVYPQYIANPKLGIHFGRARGPLLQSHSLGLQLAMMLLCAWAWRGNASRWGQAAFVLLAVCCAAAMYFTYTRCVWLGAALGGTIVLALWLRGVWRPLVLTAALGIGLLASIFLWDEVMGLKRDAGAVAARDSVSQRASFTYVSWKMFQDRPLLGFGFGQFTEAKRPYLADRSQPLYLEAIRPQPHHNTFLSLLTETGLTGVVCYLAFLGGLAAMGWRLWRMAGAAPLLRRHGIVMLSALGIYLGPAMFFDLAFSPNDHWILFLLAGMTSGIYQRAAAAPEGDSDSVPAAPSRAVGFA